VRVERRVVPVTSDEDRRIEVFERELWRIAVEHLPYGEQIQWAALAGARVAPSGWRRARAMLHFDRGGEFKRAFLLTAVQRNKNPQLRIRALQEIAAARDGEAFDTAIDVIGTWSRDERREGTKVMLLALAEKRIGRRDQANAWIWRLASYTRDVHEEYAVQRWPETKRLLGLLVNSSGAAHARNARRLVHAARKQDRRLSAALLAAAIAHSPEGEEILRGARTRLARKPSALSRELLRNFPKSRGRRGNRRRRKKGAGEGEGTNGQGQEVVAHAGGGGEQGGEEGQPRTPSRSSRRRSRSRSRNGGRPAPVVADAAAATDETPEPESAVDATPETSAPAAPAPDAAPRPPRRARVRRPVVDDAAAVEAIAGAAAALAAARDTTKPAPAEAAQAIAPADEPAAAPKRRRAPARTTAAKTPAEAAAKTPAQAAAKTPAQAAAKTAATTPAKAAAQTAGKTPAKSAAKTPAKSAAKTPAKSAAKTPARSAAKSVAEAGADDEAPAPKRRRAPVRRTVAKPADGDEKPAGGDEKPADTPADGVESAA
jgi:hypothetical protein